MESALYYVTIALGISIVVNLILKRLGVSQIIGYIMTGVTVAYVFDLRHMADSHTLEMIAEFGVVFLMFTIGLEVSLQRLATMKTDVFFNGALQVVVSALIFFALSFWVLHIPFAAALITSMALSLSSTAVVLSYLKATKEIVRPYGQKATGILIFQDIAVIPILLLIGFLSSDGGSIGDVLLQTTVSAVLIVGLLFIVGKRVMTWLLHFASSSEVDEFFMGSVLVIVVGASLLAHAFGFTYSLGAFVAGMIIAETRYHHKVESDIAPFKDLLLGTFFVTVGMKIDLALFVSHFGQIVAILAAILAIKAIVIFGVVRIYSKAKIAFKTAVALAQVGEFSFAIFALAGNYKLIPQELSQILVLAVVMSIVVTPFILSNLSRISDYFFKGVSLTESFSMLPGRRYHVIVCGYGVVGKFVAKELRAGGVDYVVVDNSYKHVEEALRDGEEVYFGDMSKTAILDKLFIKDASSVIVTLDNMEKKRLICEAVIAHAPNVKLVVKVVNLEEKRSLRGLPISITIDGKKEVAARLVSEAMRCELEK
ncbi:potassium transporter [Sulfuricurvum sp. IAE1]|jgi:CPA2 family monovalent cation:H+ antiporter-2|uniref:cation:proton antiporter n=1 Tax=Sulfuricurvum sp. IAE1 TaxID=2546102 RepID=UPI001042A4A7|nr:cation:proton antiporter [Sulfuricurvum sp. IAE1]MDD3770320.1 cation:proton antiporter [Sulfuricurvum sp.]MDX9966370.1 cation:proton antiporter [Sulfuricurvum sp.]TDA62622.1 potassium transporter [Sulfuricurvum sp. IAE1]